MIKLSIVGLFVLMVAVQLSGAPQKPVEPFGRDDGHHKGGLSSGWLTDANAECP